ISALQNVGNSNQFEEVLLPARRFVAEIGPFAGQSTLRAVTYTGRFPGKKIGEIEEITAFGPPLWKVAPHPHELRRLHLGRHDAADVIEDTVTACGALFRLGERAVVKPDDRITMTICTHRYAELSAPPVTHHQRTSGIEGDAGDLVTPNVRFPEGAPHGRADGAPDLLRIVLAVTRLRLVHVDRVLGQAEQRARAR